MVVFCLAFALRICRISSVEGTAIEKTKKKFKRRKTLHLQPTPTTRRTQKFCGESSGGMLEGGRRRGAGFSRDITAVPRPTCASFCVSPSRAEGRLGFLHVLSQLLSLFVSGSANFCCTAAVLFVSESTTRDSLKRKSVPASIKPRAVHHSAVQQLSVVPASFLNAARSSRREYYE